MSNAVNEPNGAYKEMAERWELIHDLLGGTKRMREAGKIWLPAEPREEALAYENRLERTFLYGALADTIDKIASKPFSRPVQTRNADALQAVVEDPCMKGLDMTQFARELFLDAAVHGVAHILVDYPKVGEGLSLADEREAEARPYFVRIAPPDLIGWRSERLTGGRERLTQIRVREYRSEPDGEYGDREVKRVRVLNDDTFEVWEQDEDQDWLRVDEGHHSFGRIPLVTLYFDHESFMVARPPFEDLAWLNLAHWQSNSDQRNILRFARMPLLYQFGVSEEEIDSEITIGPSQLIRSTNPDAKMGYVEHGGKAIETGDKDLRNLEAQMEVMGLQPLIQKTGGATATGRALDEARTHSNIQSWIRATEGALLEALATAGEWVNVELPDDAAVDIFSDFGLTMKAEQDIKALIDMRKASLISARTFLDEVKRRGLLSDAIDVDAEIALTVDEVEDLPEPSPFEPEQVDVEEEEPDERE